MSIDKREASTDSRLQWLDEELRQTKAALHKVEHELEQALNQIWNLDSGLRKLGAGSGGRCAAGRGWGRSCPPPPRRNAQCNVRRSGTQRKQSRGHATGQRRPPASPVI